MDGPDLELAVFHHLRGPQGLGTGEGEVELARYPPLEEVKMLRPADGGDQHVQTVHLLRVHPRQRTREKVGLLLIVPLQSDQISGPDDPLERLDDPSALEHLPLGKPGPSAYPLRLGLLSALPVAWAARRDFADSTALLPIPLIG